MVVVLCVVSVLLSLSDTMVVVVVCETSVLLSLSGTVFCCLVCDIYIAVIVRELLLSHV